MVVGVGKGKKNVFVVFFGCVVCVEDDFVCVFVESLRDYVLWVKLVCVCG